MPAEAELQRVAYSPGEFAALFGKSQTWGYRQIYAGKVKAITEHGRILVPASEVERILGSAGRYEGQKKKQRSKEELEKLKPQLLSAWALFVQTKRVKAPSKPIDLVRRLRKSRSTQNSHARRAALKRLTRK